MPFFHVLRRFHASNLGLRLLSSALIAPLVLAAVYVGGLPYDAVVTGVITLGFYEWLRLVSPHISRKRSLLSCTLVLLVLLLGSLVSLECGAIMGGIATLVLFLASSLYARDKSALKIALGVPYMAGSGLALLALRAAPDTGAGLVFFLIAVVWGTDTGAYLAGRLIGGPKLAPTLSPSKTWAGLVGGVLLALGLGYATVLFLGAQQPWIALSLAPVLAIISQIGDLFESHIKRQAGAKESGEIIPGHGGILDRIDGLVFAACFFLVFQTTLGTSLAWW